MSMIEKQIEDLQGLADYLKENNILGGRTVLEAIDTIKALSAKVQTQNLHDGWHIVADGDLPKDDEKIIYTRYDKLLEVDVAHQCMGWWFKENLQNMKAWRPFPKPYKEN